MIAAAALFIPVSTAASEMWSEDYYRANDNTGGLSDAEREDLDRDCIEFMKKYGADIALISVGEEEYEGITLEECARLCYEQYGYGYGPDRICFIVICDPDNEKVEIATFGGADKLVDRKYLDYAEQHIIEYKEEYGVYGILYGGQRYISNYLRDHGTGEADSGEEKLSSQEAEIDEAVEKSADAENIEAENTEAAAKTDTTSSAENADAENPQESAGDGAANGNGATASGMPYWYAEDISTFELFHNDKAPRVVDDADMLSDAEEKSISDRLWELRDELDRDIVIFTDMSTHGLERKVYAADFYEMNGYGRGDEYEGAVLFICMDPNDRGWWTSCMGSETMGLYTEEVANAIDDELYEHMVAGTYADGIAEWAENFAGMYRNGNPFAPDWLINGPASSRAGGMRIDDLAELFTDEEIASLTAHADEISEKYGADIIVHTAPVVAALGMTVDEYAEKYYRYGCIGSAYDDNGLEFLILKTYEGSFLTYVCGSGGCEEKLTEVNATRLLGNFKDTATSEYTVYKATDKYLDQADHMLKTGRVPRTGWYWGLMSVLGAIGAMISGGTTLGRAKKKMETPAIKTDADIYLVKDTMNIDAVDRFITTHTSRKYSPVKTDRSSSSGSSSSGRSSYSSSYSSSSGHTHSGSGRNF